MLGSATLTIVMSRITISWRAQDEGEGTHRPAAALPGGRGAERYGRCR